MEAGGGAGGRVVGANGGEGGGAVEAGGGRQGETVGGGAVCPGLTYQPQGSPVSLLSAEF